MGLISTFIRSFKGLGTNKGFARSEAMLIKQAYELVRENNQNLKPPKIYEETLKNVRGISEDDASHILENTARYSDGDRITLQDVARIYVQIAYMQKVGGPPGIRRAQKLADAIEELDEGVNEIITSNIEF